MKIKLVIFCHWSQKRMSFIQLHTMSECKIPEPSTNQFLWSILLYLFQHISLWPFHVYVSSPRSLNCIRSYGPLYQVMTTKWDISFFLGLRLILEDNLSLKISSSILLNRIGISWIKISQKMHYRMHYF